MIFLAGLRERAAVFAAVVSFGTFPASASMFPASPFSDASAGGTAASFLKLPAGARPESLGGAFAAAADASEAIFWNPAGLIHVPDRGHNDVSVSYDLLLAGSNATALAYARPVGPGVLGTGLRYFSAGSIQGYDTLQNPTVTYTPYDVAVQGAYAMKFEYFSAGAGLKFIRSSVAEASGSSAAIDLGLQAPRISDIGEGPLDAGISIVNLGPPMKIGSVSAPLPFAIQPGFLWRISPQIHALLDGHFPVDQDPYASIGVEGLIPITNTALASLRLGYNSAHMSNVDGLTGLTIGFGLDLKRFRLDYAWIPYGDLGSANRISLGFTF